MTCAVINADCMDAMRELIARGVQVDSIVTDPPYELGFMGKQWDRTGISYQRLMWKMCFDLLKPGGHLLSFGGSRTYHRMACAIEDAGFEIRDQIMWVTGQGFPKSQDISKAIDKMAGAEREIGGYRPQFPDGTRGATYAGMKQRGVTEQYKLSSYQETVDGMVPVTIPATEAAKQWQGWGSALKPSHEDLFLAFKPYKIKDLCNILAHDIMNALCQLPSHANAVKQNLKLSQSVFGEVYDSALWNAVEKCNTPEDLFALMGTLPLGKVRPLSLSIASSWLLILDAILVQENTFTIETELSLITDLKTLSFLLSKNTQGNIILDAINRNGTESSAYRVINIFSGLSAKLEIIQEHFAQENATLKGHTGFQEDQGKISHNPIVLARKPLSEKTIAENVLKHGTGAINIDECRVGIDFNCSGRESAKNTIQKTSGIDFKGNKTNTQETPLYNTQGRFPANLIHDGSDEVEEEFAKYETAKAYSEKSSRTSKGSWFTNFQDQGRIERFDMGGGSPSRFFYCAKASKKDRNGSKHPTVKPIALMRYLCRLITQPGGTILDPFAGSGTTGQAALEEGFNVILIEKEKEYVDDINKRI